MKIIFLDIDGVLNTKVSCANSQAMMKTKEGDWDQFNPIFSCLAWDPHCISQLLRVVRKTKAKIVLSSSWRSHPEHTRNCLKACSVIYLDTDPEHPLDFIDVTPQEGVDIRIADGRGSEIKAWLDTHPEVNTYCILDDYTKFLEEQLPFFVNTDPHVGLTKDQADQMIRILDKTNSVPDNQIKDHNEQETTHSKRSS